MILGEIKDDENFIAFFNKYSSLKQKAEEE